MTGVLQSQTTGVRDIHDSNARSSSVNVEIHSFPANEKRVRGLSGGQGEEHK